MLYRVIIKKETDKYYIGKSYDNKKYKILKNDNIKNLKDYNKYMRLNLIYYKNINPHLKSIYF